MQHLYSSNRERKKDPYFSNNRSYVYSTNNIFNKKSRDILFFS